MLVECKAIISFVHMSLILTVNYRFRWVALQLDALQHCPSESKLKACLQDLPTGLDATYDCIFAAIDVQYHDDIKRILGWLAFSKEALTLDQLAETVAFVSNEDGRLKFNPKNKWNPALIKQICVNLISVTDGKKLSINKFLT
jgi:hypothetical protein